jgi:hypothetical protein
MAPGRTTGRVRGDEGAGAKTGRLDGIRTVWWPSDNLLGSSMDRFIGFAGVALFTFTLGCGGGGKCRRQLPSVEK